jgi:RNA:NAD 2'-phosphotransferase (TPT1/KptA family)
VGSRDPVVRTSKHLSLILRHQPEKYDLVMDKGGWVVIDDILAAIPWMDRAKMEWANTQDALLVEKARTSELPRQPNRVKLDALCQEMTRTMHG